MNWLLSLFKSIVFQTVISGVLVFVLSEIIQKFFLEPFQKYKKVIGEIDNQLKFYANIIANPDPTNTQIDLYKKCSGIMRRLSCKLESTYKQIPCKRLKTSEKISDAASRLIGLSNSLYQNSRDITNDDDVKEIRKDLNIPKL